MSRKKKLAIKKKTRNQKKERLKREYKINDKKNCRPRAKKNERRRKIAKSGHINKENKGSEMKIKKKKKFL